jgi:hypothetical protein
MLPFQKKTDLQHCIAAATETKETVKLSSIRLFVEQKTEKGHPELTIL